MLKLKPLNKKGFGHVEMIVFAVVILAIGGIGYFALNSSSASDDRSNKWSDCWTYETFWIKKRTGTVFLWSKGSAVQYVVLELDRFTEPKTVYGAYGGLSFTYPKVTTGPRRERTSTTSAWCPNVPNNHGGHGRWRTSTQRLLQEYSYD